jgi:hypothetical protein
MVTGAVPAAVPSIETCDPDGTLSMYRVPVVGTGVVVEIVRKPPAGRDMAPATGARETDRRRRRMNGIFRDMGHIA